MKKRLLNLFLVFLIPLLILSGCGEEKNFEGEICHLEYKEGYTTIVPVTTFIFTGKTTIPIITNHVRTYPDRWYVEVRNFNTEKQEYEYNDCYVTEECFNQLKLGDWFVYDTDYCFEEEPYTQVKE